MRQFEIHPRRKCGLFFEKCFYEHALSEQVKGQFLEILAFMDKEDKSKYWAKFLQETGKLDELRGEDLKMVSS